MSKQAFPLQPLSVVIKIVVLAIGVAFVGEQTSRLSDLPFVDGDLRHNLTLISIFAITLLAPGFYLCAVWAASNVLPRMQRGDAFAPVMVKALREVGGLLVAGAVTAMVLSPSLTTYLGDRLRGVRVDIEIESLTIGILGLVLLVVSRQGQKLRQEVESYV